MGPVFYMCCGEPGRMRQADANGDSRATCASDGANGAPDHDRITTGNRVRDLGLERG